MLLLALAFAVGTPLGAPALRAQDPLDDSQHVARLREQASLVARLAREGAWERVIEEAHVQRELVARGTDAWFDAQHWLVEAHHARWEPEQLELEARATLIEASEQRARDPHATRSPLGPLHPWSAGWVIGVQIELARLEQSRGAHELALGRLEVVLDELRARLPVHEGGDLMARAGLEAGRSLLALRRFDEARTLLRSLCDAYPETHPARVSAALLGDLPGEEDPYRGRFAADPVHAERRKALRAALPRARARLAEILGRPEAELPRVRLGIADGAPEQASVDAFTDYDPRRPAEPASIVVLANGLALGRSDPERLLMHELTHAVLLEELGLAYEGLPSWLSEGLVQAICGELEQQGSNYLAVFLLRDAGRYLDPRVWRRRVFDYGPAPPGELPSLEEAMLVVQLAEAAEGRGVRRLLEATDEGATVEEALRAVTGLSLEEYWSVAGDRTDAFIAELRRRSLGVVSVIELARREGPRRVAGVAATYLEQDLDPVAEGHARRRRAEALEQLGRYVEALFAWSELSADAVRHPVLVDLALFGRARCLERLGHADDARQVLQFLCVVASVQVTRETAARMLARLPQKK